MHVRIKIGAVGDPPLFPEFKPDAEATLTGVCILEKGMESGSVSMAFLVEGAGKKLTLQLSASMLLAIAGAVRGACERCDDTRNL